MRLRAIWLVALLLLAVGAEAQDFIKYFPAPVAGTSGGGATFTAPILLPNGTALAVALRFSASAAGTGWYSPDGSAWDFANGGTATIRIASTQVTLLNAAGTIGVISGTSIAQKTITLPNALMGSASKTLTDAAAAASIWSCAVPTSDSIGGELIWTTESTDATDYRVTQGAIRFAGVNKAGTTTCTVGVIGTDLTASSNGNTLVCTWTNVASGTTCLLSATCTDNTAGSQTMAVNSRLDMPIAQVCTAQ